MSKHRALLAAATSGLLTLTAVVAVPPSWAAPPDNDNRANAIRVKPPQDITGTLVDATLEKADESYCGDTDGSVWYRFTASQRGAVIVELDAGGDMDATVDLYRQVRSKLDWVDCEGTDSKGIATIDSDDLEPGGDYAIRVANQTGSTAASFQLRVLVPSPPPEPPGRRLPTKGVKSRVDRLADSGKAYWTRMREGRTMRLSLRTRQCTTLEIYAPGTRDFDGVPEKTLQCGGFRLFTPTESGRHFLVVRAGRSRGAQPYHLRVAPARRDDTIPGVFIGNNARVEGRVNGGLDARDLYRFDVTRRSTLTLRVSGGPSLRLVRDDGRRLARGSWIERSIPVGRYFVAVEGSGKYTLSRVSRTITSSRVSFNGRRSTTVSPGSAVRLALGVRPAVTGPGSILVERFDPIDGWQFLRKYRMSISNGSATTSFVPPSVGRYRAYGKFAGTRIAAKSDSGVARLRVQGPLVD